jgi:hypothetical protein
MAGYSKTPLVQKLGIKPGSRLALENPPASLRDDLAPLPERVEFVKGATGPADVVICFVTSERQLRDQFAAQAKRIFPSGLLWISWPKKASGVATDLGENLIRDIGLEAGLVDVKVCAIDDTWSGLKFVVRVKDRPKTPPRSPTPARRAKSTK